MAALLRSGCRQDTSPYVPKMAFRELRYIRRNKASTGIIFLKCKSNGHGGDSPCRCPLTVPLLGDWICTSQTRFSVPLRLKPHDANAFPIEDVGVAQGNSLSPLLGNLLLKDFDKELNALPNIRCIRYIDDFIILGLNKQTTWKAFLKAQALLSQWNMELAVDKTFQGSSQQCFEFLGIEFNNGFLRPSSASRARFMDSAKALLSDAAAALIQYRSSGLIERRVAFLKTLITLSETITGWGMHYRFCNDSLCLRKLDEEISHLLKDYFGKYRDVREAAGPASTWDLLGIQSLEKIEKQSFTWPKRSKTA
jgi:RNA-directed DNA polymerase